MKTMTESFGVKLAAFGLMCAGLLCSCTKQSTGGQLATVVMRDGTQTSGTLVSSSSTEIQLMGDDKQTHTIPMAQVRSIEYQDQLAGSASASSISPAAATATTPDAVPPDISHADHYHPAAAAITTKTFVVPAGSEVSVRSEETIDSGRAVDGQTFAAELTKNVLDGAGDVVIPRGSNAQIVIRSASTGGRIRGASDLVLDLASISVEGQQYQVSTTDVVERGKAGVGANRRTGIFAGGGAAFGAVIGAIAGGGKGAAIGAASGAGAGTAAEILTKGKIKLPAETILTFRLDQPLQVTAAQ